MSAARPGRRAVVLVAAAVVLAVAVSASGVTLRKFPAPLPSPIDADVFAHAVPPLQSSHGVIRPYQNSIRSSDS